MLAIACRFFVHWCVLVFVLNCSEYCHGFVCITSVFILPPYRSICSLCPQYSMSAHSRCGGILHVLPFNTVFTDTIIPLYFTIVWPCIVTDSLWIKPTAALKSSSIGIMTLHVSGSLSAHHQEFLAVHRLWYILCSCDDRLLPGVGWHSVPSYSW